MQRMSMNELATILGESVQTCRVLTREFALFIPATRVGEECFFRPEAVEILRLILVQLEVGVRKDYIDTMLSKRCPVAEVSIMTAAEAPAPQPLAAITGGLVPSSPDGEEATTVTDVAAANPRAADPTSERTGVIADAGAIAIPDLIVTRRLDDLASNIEALAAQVGTLLNSRPRAEEPVSSTNQASMRASSTTGAVAAKVRAFDRLPSREE